MKLNSETPVTAPLTISFVVPAGSGSPTTLFGLDSNIHILVRQEGAGQEQEGGAGEEGAREHGRSFPPGVSGAPRGFAAWAERAAPSRRTN